MRDIMTRLLAGVRSEAGVGSGTAKGSSLSQDSVTLLERSPIPEPRVARWGGSGTAKVSSLSQDSVTLLERLPIPEPRVARWGGSGTAKVSSLSQDSVTLLERSPIPEPRVARWGGSGTAKVSSLSQDSVTLLERSPIPEPRVARWGGSGTAKVSSLSQNGGFAPGGSLRKCCRLFFLSLPGGILAAMLFVSGDAWAAVPAKVVAEAAEYVTKTFAREAAEEGSESIARQAASLAARYGDEGLEALRKAGPRGFRVIEEAGEHGLDAVKLINRHGDDAVWAISRPGGMEILMRYGDDGARAIMRHKGVADEIIQAHGRAAVEALNAVSPQQARRIAMLRDDGLIAAGESGEKLLGVVARYGDAAMDFIWRNKFALGTAAVLGTFLADPEPYLDGTKALVVEGISRPVSEFGKEAARNTNWTLVALVGIGVLGLLAALRTWLRARRLRESPRG